MREGSGLPITDRDRCGMMQVVAPPITPAPTIVTSLAARLRDEGLRAAVLIGSVGRGTATEHSDVDVLVVACDGSPRPPFERTMYGTRLVEIVAMTYEAWLAHLDSARPRWMYAFLDAGAIMFDDGSFASLRARSEDVLTSYETPVEIRAELATMLWHSQAKLERAELSKEPRCAAYWAAVVLPGLLDALVAVHNRPTVPGSHRLAVVSSLDLDPSDERLLEVAFTADPDKRLAATRSLTSSLLERLGPADLQRLKW